MILLVARLLLAAVFAVAAVGKLTGRSRTVETLAEFGVAEPLRRPVAIALPLAELAIAIALLPAATAAWAALTAAILLAVFTAAVARTLALGREVDCNCFGSLGPSRISRWTLARNAILLVLAGGVAIAAQGDPGTSAVAWLGDLDTAGVAILVAAVAVVAAALNFAFSWQLMRQNGRLLNDLKAIQDGGGAAAPSGPQPGHLAPSFVLPALGGGGLSLEEMLAGGRGLVVVVTDPGCGACEPLLPEIGRLQRDPETAVPLVMISRGDPDANLAKAQAHGLETVLLEEGFEVSRALGINGAPGAVRLDREGRYLAKPSMGTERVGVLLGELTATPELTVHQGGN
ncbi:MAG: redoxin domain-containing protein [Actinobacteria bacterium]|nr:redoxin domain-containing protein [Actinomycetota bacterium]